MHLIEQHLKAKLNERAEAGNLRRLVTNRAAVDLFSNDYLGFVADNILHTDSFSYSMGATGSRLLSGNSVAAEELEQQIAAFHQSPAALLFNSGYDANIGLLTSIADRHTVYLYDELCHASIIDGIRLSQAQKRYKFLHNDINDLEEKIKRVNNGHVVIVVESVYSMDGDMAPLSGITTLAKQYNIPVIVDEAHATGVFGTRGQGLVQQLGLQQEVFARVHTFGKALGCHGAAVVGSELLKEYLINFARSFIYTTALPPHTIMAIKAAYQHLSSTVFSNDNLHELIKYFRQQIDTQPTQNWKDSISPIQALVIGDNYKAKVLAEKLQNAGMQVNAILSPTVALGEERLRICLHSFNTTNQIDKLLSVINAAYE